MTRLLAFTLISVAALALTSCASISVSDGTEAVRLHKPETIYVMAFATEQADIEVDRNGDALADFKKNLQVMLRTGMAADITDKLMPAFAETRPERDRGRNAWLVRGQFTTVKQGSRLLRSAIGFGAGGTKLETRVEVFDMAENPDVAFLTFTTTGGSNAEPGAILAFTTDPLEIAIGGVSGAAHGLSEDTARTAREITAQLSDYMYQRGWISEDQRIEPKHQSAGGMW